MPSDTCVFVYGTLKRGQPRHHALAGQEFIDQVTTVADYRMFCVADYPGLVEVAEGEGLQIEGEIWRVDAETLRRLDDIEAVDEGWYERKPIRLNDDNLPALVEAWFYLHDVSGCEDCGEAW